MAALAQAWAKKAAIDGGSSEGRAWCSPLAVGVTVAPLQYG